jgi:hypothetical protein
MGKQPTGEVSQKFVVVLGPVNQKATHSSAEDDNPEM